MDYFEDVARTLNAAGVELKQIKSEKTELIKKLFLLSKFFKDCSKTAGEDNTFQPFANYLAVRYKEMESNLLEIN